MFRQETFFPRAGNVIGLSDRNRRTNSSAAGQRNLQKIQNATDVCLVIFTKIFVFDTERVDPDPSEKSFPEFFLLLALLKTLFNQFSVELRFALDSFASLYFPETSLMCARFRQRLPELVTPDDVHKLETRKTISQKIEISCSCVAERAGFA